MYEVVGSIEIGVQLVALMVLRRNIEVIGQFVVGIVKKGAPSHRDHRFDGVFWIVTYVTPEYSGVPGGLNVPNEDGPRAAPPPVNALYILGKRGRLHIYLYKMDDKYRTSQNKYYGRRFGYYN